MKKNWKNKIADLLGHWFVAAIAGIVIGLFLVCIAYNYLNKGDVVVNAFALGAVGGAICDACSFAFEHDKDASENKKKIAFCLGIVAQGLFIMGAIGTIALSQGWFGL